MKECIVIRRTNDSRFVNSLFLSCFFTLFILGGSPLDWLLSQISFVSPLQRDHGIN